MQQSQLGRGEQGMKLIIIGSLLIPSTFLSIECITLFKQTHPIAIILNLHEEYF